MKKIILLLFIPIVFTCSSDSSDDNIDDTNPVYLDTNGVTIKARDWAVIGDQGTINGITYTIVSRETLVNMIDNKEDLTRICTSRIIDMRQLFGGEIFNQDISDWDVSNVTTMEGMFAGSTFNQPIGDWDVSNVTSMRNMFLLAGNTGINVGSFDQDLSLWDVSNVTTMERMFAQTFFNQPIGDWDVSNVTNMHRMFSSSLSFNHISDWDISSVTEISYMFEGAVNLINPLEVGILTISWFY